MEIKPLAEHTAEELVGLEERLKSYDGPDRVVASDALREEFKNRPKKSYSFPTGLANLDEAIGSLESGELIAIGGPTKNGKTLLAQTITANLSAAGTGCLWFSFEVPERQFLSQMHESVKFYLPRELKQSSLGWLRERILEAKFKNNARVVFIDNLHHLVDFTTVRNVSLDLGVIIRALKRMAIELNVVIAVLCHSKKPAVDKSGNVPEVSEWDLRDSSFIPQECDSTIMVQRKLSKETGEVQNTAIVKVCLHRRTGTMGRVIHVVKVGDRLEEDVRVYEALR